MCGRPCLLPKNGLGSAVSFLVGSAAYPPANCSYGAENLSYNFYILVEFLLGSKPVIKTLRIGVEVTGNQSDCRSPFVHVHALNVNSEFRLVS